MVLEREGSRVCLNTNTDKIEIFNFISVRFRSIIYFGGVVSADGDIKLDVTRGINSVG